MHFSFDFAAFVLDDDPHDFVVFWVKASLDVFQSDDGLLGLLLVLPQHFDVVHVLDFSLNVFIEFGEVLFYFVENVLLD